jgi:hypothetical protein
MGNHAAIEIRLVSGSRGPAPISEIDSITHCRRLFRIIAVAAFGGAIACFIQASALALPITYTYSSPNYTSIADSPSISGSYTTSMNINGWITFDESALTKNYLTSADLIDFAFSDGRNQLTKLTASILSFELDFNSLGDPYYWHVTMSQNSSPSGANLANGTSIYLSITPSIASTQFTKCITDNGFNCTQFAYDTANGPYTTTFEQDWSESTALIPSAFPLFASGLGALGLLGWRKKRKKVAAKAAA